MFHLIRSPAGDPWREPNPHPEPGRDPMVRAVRIGLLVYLAPVALLVAAIGIASIGVKAAGRWIHGPKLGPAESADRRPHGRDAHPAARRRVTAVR